MTAEPADQAADVRVPEPIRAMGPRAIEVYRRLFAESGWAASTQQNYANNLARFFRWADSRSLTTVSITPAHISAYRDEMAARLSYQQASAMLSPVPALFRQLQASGLIVQAFGKARSSFRTPLEKGQPLSLLSVMTVLAKMEEGSLRRMLTEDAAAVMLLEFLRWPEGRRCPHCDAEDESRLLTGRYLCGFCGREYRVASGTILDECTLPLSSALSVLHAAFLAVDQPATDEAWANARGLDPAAVASLVARIRQWLDGQGISDRASLERVLKEEDLRLVEQQIGRELERACGMMDAMAEVRHAQAEGNTHPDLPPGMTNEEAMAKFQAELNELDGYVIYLENGRLAKRLATAEELANLASTVTDGTATEDSNVP